MHIARVTSKLERHSRVHAARLRLLHGKDAGLEIDLPAVGVVVGADSGCDVVLDDPAVSRRHATIVATREGFELTDLDSRNGTWVDGVAVTKVVVPVGTTVRFGSTLIELLPAETSVDIEPSEATHFGDLVGSSVAMRRIFSMLERASRADAPILLIGESGTGKELAARAVGAHGGRSKGPFVVFDCGAASENLIESDLFGHVRGSFTGAHADRAGAFSQAHGGTLFLDEIGDLPLSLQPKLLRAIERGEVTPLGGKRAERYDVRIVAATHRDLWQEVARGTFRGDLYYRLAVIELHLPALRQRPDDLAMLVRQFLRANGASDEGVEGPALERLVQYAWPGNVRELRNVIARAVALAPAGTKFPKLPILLRAASVEEEAPLATCDESYHDAKERIVRRFQRDYLTDLMRKHGDNLSQAARIAGVERKYLYRLLAEADMLPSGGRESRDDGREP